jgi:hypothetical protein
MTRDSHGWASFAVAFDPADRAYFVADAPVAPLLRWDGSSWVLHAPPPGGEKLDARLVFHTDGTPHLVWRVDTAIRVARWDGTSWAAFGPSLTAGGINEQAEYAGNPAMALDAAGQPTVAWEHQTATGFEIHLRQWDGTTWNALGESTAANGIGNRTRPCRVPDVVLDDDGRPIVGWEENERIWVFHWTGTSWVELLGSVADAGILDVPACSIRLARASGSPDLVASFLANGSSVYLLRWDGAAWNGLGGSATGGGLTYGAHPQGRPGLALDPAGRPIVSWATWSEAGAPRVTRWTGAAWDGLGGSNAAPGVSATDGEIPFGAQALAVDSLGTPVVAWLDDMDRPGTSQGWPIYLRQWSGTAWSELGAWPYGSGLSDTPRTSRMPALAMDASGVPAVAWLERTEAGPEQVYLKQWNSAAWTGLGGSASGDGLNPPGRLNDGGLEVEIDGSGRPIVAWSDTASVRVRQWDGSAWVGLAGSDTGVAAGREPGLSVRASDGAVFLTWVGTDAGTPQVYLRQWDGGAWVELSGSASGGGISQNQGAGADAEWPRVRVDSIGRPVVAWGAYPGNPSHAVYLKRLEGGAWLEVGASATGGGIGDSWTGGVSLAVDSQDRPVVAWANEVVRWDGTAWTQLAGSGMPFATSSPVFRPVEVAVDGQDRVVVAWEANETVQWQVHVARWDNGVWSDIAASNQEGGVSNSAGPALDVALAARGSRVCVAWCEPAAPNLEILLRCTDD